jgi:hypothetical protein
MHGLRRRQFETLLRSLFDVQELYRLLGALGRDFADSLRPGLSLVELIADAISLLERHGGWEALFLLLARERPPAHPQIAEVAALFEVRVAPDHRSGTAPTNLDTIEALLGDADGADRLFQRV